jgi:hypothetical protein
MASSTTMLYGTDCVIEAELGTTTVDLSGSSNTATINLEMIIGEASVFNDKWPQRVMTAKNCTIDVAAWYSSAANEAADYFQDWFNEAAPEPREFSIYIPSKTVGAKVVNGNFVFNGLNIAAKTAETNPIPITMQLLNAGAITVTAYST